MIFSTVSTFVEQVGRRLVWKWGELDGMTCTWNGPSVAALDFKPTVNSSHPEYPLMFCTDSQITKHEAQIAEIQATYQGIIQSGGASSWKTPGIVSVSATQGSRDFQLPYIKQLSSAVYTLLAGPGGVPTQQGVLSFPAYYSYGTQRVNVRYIGEQVSVRYQACPRPDANRPNYESLGKGLVTWSILSTYRGEISIAGSWVELSYATQQLSNVPQSVPPLFAAYLGMQLSQKGKWYDVTEQYGPTF